MRKAFCFDLDGTLTRYEILPILAREAGLFEEISALTDATIKGVIPFNKSFLLRCKLLDELSISKAQTVVARIPIYEKLASYIQARKDNCFIITGNLDVWIAPLAKKFGCKVFSSSAIVSEDRLQKVLNVLDKGSAIAELRRSFDLIVAVGDGMGDVSMFSKSDIRIAFGATHPPVESLLQFTDYIAFNERSLCNLLNTQ